MSSSTKPESFMFETEFAPDGKVVSSGETSFKRYRQEEVDALCAEARQQGVAAVEAETERRIAAVAEGVLQHLNPILPFAKQLAEQMRRECAELALLAARKLAGAALEHVPDAAIEDSLSEVLSHLPKGFRIVLKVHPDVAERIGAAIAPRLPAESELIVEHDPKAGHGAWDLHWDSGGFSHDPQALAERLDAILHDHLNQSIEEQGDLFASIA